MESWGKKEDIARNMSKVFIEQQTKYAVWPKKKRRKKKCNLWLFVVLVNAKIILTWKI